MSDAVAVALITGLTALVMAAINAAVVWKQARTAAAAAALSVAEALAKKSRERSP